MLKLSGAWGPLRGVREGSGEKRKRADGGDFGFNFTLTTRASPPVLASLRADHGGPWGVGLGLELGGGGESNFLMTPSGEGASQGGLGEAGTGQPPSTSEELAWDEVCYANGSA